MDFFDIHESQCEKHNMIELHSHSHFELYFLLNGTRRYFIDSAMFDLKENCLLIIPPFSNHKTEGDAFHRINISADPSFFQPHEIKFLNEYASKYIIDFSQVKDQIKNQLSEIIDCYTAKPKNFLHTLKTLIGYLLYTLDKKCVKNNSYSNYGKMPVQIIKIIDYINKHYEEKITLQSLSQMFFISVPALCKNFKQAARSSVMEFLLHVRIAKAKELLLTSKKTIEEISTLTGFSSANYFGMIFKQKTGMSPFKYKKYKTT